ncbi:unnamed protein product [Brassica napus]|uniref:(rape) hypothetical protein n=1 Tax=Brassica napus TaxID=3708 RepID=A0A816IEK4_BRANA|nr:unnamed protein product [Brassica napus]
MPPVLQFRKLCSNTISNDVNEAKHPSTSTGKPKRRRWGRWSCIYSCCWAIGYICTAWWVLLFLYSSVPVLSSLQAPESPGARFGRDGVKAHHPVVLVHGIVTGGLELWEDRACAEGLFRKRLWVTNYTCCVLIYRPLCWLDHLSLDSETGLDPLGIRVRAVRGLVAADHFSPCYFAWTVLIENLAKIEYEGKNLHMASYDWRLFFHNTEIRDQSLSRLKSKIELMYVTNGYKKVVVVPHSLVNLYKNHNWGLSISFTSSNGLKHIFTKEVVVVVQVAISNLLSAEGKDFPYASEMSRESILKLAENTAYTATTVLDLFRFIAPKMMRRAEAHFCHGIAEDLDDPKYGHYKYWSNPLETKLPDAPEMEMHCLYGVGIPTERSYVYKLSSISGKCKSSIPFRIDRSMDGDNSCLKGGARFADGEESVPVISAGFMCAKGWRGKTRFYPAGMETFVRE